MGDKNPKRLGIVGSTSKFLGASVGTAVATGRKIADFDVRSVMAVGDLHSRPVEGSAAVMDESATGGLAAEMESELAETQRQLEQVRFEAEETQSQLESQFRHLQSEKESLILELESACREANEMKAREGAVRARVAALESDLAAAWRESSPFEGPRELEKAGSGEGFPKRILSRLGAPEKYAKSPLLSDVITVRTAAEPVLSDRGQEKVAVVAVVPVVEEVESSMEATIAQPDDQINVRVAEVEAPSPPEVMPEQVDAAVFSNAAEKIIFTRALSDIASQDAAVRVDAVRAMAGIRHELSVKALAGQMASEASPQVRQECIKSLTTLGMKKGLPAVKRALTDRAASVRLVAVRALYRLAGAESAPALIRMFSDENEDVRRRAATCIGWLGQAELAVELLPLLADSSVSVRRATVDAIGNLHSWQVVGALIEYLNDPEKAIRKAILNALETITGKKMSGPFPRDEESLQRLIAQWHEWWKAEHLVDYHR